MELPGAGQMKFVRNLMETFPLTERIPDQSLIVENNYFQPQRKYRPPAEMIMPWCIPAGLPFTLYMGKISG